MKSTSHIDDGPFVTLNSGGQFYFLKPELSTISIHDIALGLSLESRFSGQVGRYCVAEHCCHSCDLAAELYPGTELEHLLHDAQEFVFKDVATPLKNLLTEYKALEKSAHRFILKHFNANPDVDYKAVDDIMLNIEARALFNPIPSWVERADQNTPRVEIQRWNPTQAYSEFLIRFVRYSRLHEGLKEVTNDR